MSFNKVVRREKIRKRIRSVVSGTAQRPRLSVFRSNSEIYAQLIDDLSGVTLVASSTRSKGFEKKGTRIDQSKQVGVDIARKAAEKGITEVVFDRGGFLYHGRIKSLAEGAREGGLKF